MVDFIKLIVIYIARFFQCFLFWIPVKNNRIVFYAYKRKGYTCNPKYIAEALLKNKNADLDLIWVTQYPEAAAEIRDRGIEVIKFRSLRYFIKQFTAKILITNDSFGALIRKRRKQYLINTWHGSGAYKKVGYANEAFHKFPRSIILSLCHKNTDFIPSGTGNFIKETACSFKVPPENIFLCGTPRNDIFAGDNIELKSAIKRRLEIPENKKIIIYAPTFRKVSKKTPSLYDLDIPNLLNALKQRFGNEWICLFRSHYFDNKKIPLSDNHVIDVSTYPDMQELLYISDVCITDYSSAIWDFSLTGRPSFMYATDLDEYLQNERDFYTPVKKWPYPFAGNNKQLQKNIVDFDYNEYREKLKKHHEELGCYEPGTASLFIAEKIINLCYPAAKDLHK